MNWTDTKIEQLKELWEQGSIATEIAKELGTSRCSVLGKANRLNLTPRKRGCSSGTRQPSATPKPKEIPLYTVEELKNRPTLEEIEFHQCRYPLGERNDPPKYFCGHDRYKNYSYCKPHVELCTDKKEFDLNNKP